MSEIYMDTSWLEEIKADKERLKALPKEEKLSSLVQLAEEHLALEGLIKELEHTLSLRKKRYRDVSEGLLPELLSELGVSSFTLSNGLKVTDRQFIDAKITDPTAYDWLESHGEGEIVKTAMNFTVRRTEKERLKPLLDLASQMDVDIVLKESVHHMTLKSFVGESLRRGTQIPLELFNVYVGHRVSIK
jgi:hypothetical protein